METAVYIAMRRDLNMPRGKEIAQAIHAAAYLGAADQKTVCVRAESLEHLEELVAEARAAGVGAAMVTDAGRTVFKEPTQTCAAIGPVVPSRLPKLSAARCY